MAFAKYHSARRLTRLYLKKSTRHNPASRLYFEAIAEWESCLLNLQIFVDLLSKLDRSNKIFTKRSGTAEERAYELANDVKHRVGKLLQRSKKHYHIDDTIPVWLTNTGFQSRARLLSYDELADLIDGMAALAERLLDPRGFVETAKKTSL